MVGVATTGAATVRFGIQIPRRRGALGRVRPSPVARRLKPVGDLRLGAITWTQRDRAKKIGGALIEPLSVKIL